MDFLKEILGDELFATVKEKVDAYNGDEANKDKPIKIGNLGGGDYVSKLKFDDLQEALNGRGTELESANNLIAQLKKDNKNDESLQEKVKEYEEETEKLQEELAKTKVNSALKVALLSEKAVDVDYLTYKLKEKLADGDESLELDENENIKGWDEKLDGLKVQFPNMFEKPQSLEDKKIEPNKLNREHGTETLTKADILSKPYAERNKLYNENPEAFREAMGK